jgi:hypothetical protein
VPPTKTKLKLTDAERRKLFVKAARKMQTSHDPKAGDKARRVAAAKKPTKKAAATPV